MVIKTEDPLAAALSLLEMLKGIIEVLKEENEELKCFLKKLGYAMVIEGQRGKIRWRKTSKIIRIKDTVEDFVIKHAISPENAEVLLVCLGDLVDRGIPPVEIMKTMKRIKSKTWRCVIPIGICSFLFGDCNECLFNRNKK